MRLYPCWKLNLHRLFCRTIIKCVYIVRRKSISCYILSKEMLPSPSESFSMIKLVASFGYRVPGGDLLSQRKRGTLYRSRKQDTGYIDVFGVFGLGKERKENSKNIRND